MNVHSRLQSWALWKQTWTVVHLLGHTSITKHQAFPQHQCQCLIKIYHCCLVSYQDHSFKKKYPCMTSFTLPQHWPMNILRCWRPTGWLLFINTVSSQQQRKPPFKGWHYSLWNLWSRLGCQERRTMGMQPSRHACAYTFYKPTVHRPMTLKLEPTTRLRSKPFK